MAALHAEYTFCRKSVPSDCNAMMKVTVFATAIMGTTHSDKRDRTRSQQQILCRSAALRHDNVPTHIQSACQCLKTHICAEVSSHNQLMQFVNCTHVWLLTIDDCLQHSQHASHGCLACAEIASAIQVMLFTSTTMLTRWLIFRSVTL